MNKPATQRYKEDDFNVTFDATENDNSLRVRRQIYSGRLPQPVVVDNVYDRTSDVAEVYNDSRPVMVKKAGPEVNSSCPYGDAQRLFRQPTASEVSRLTYGLRDLRVGVQEEARNDFAHLLNRGS